MIAKNVICLKDGATSLNDYNWDDADRKRYELAGVADNPEWDANRARGLEALIELVKANPEEWKQFNVGYSESLKRYVLHIIEKQNGISYSFYAAYEQDELENVPF